MSARMNKEQVPPNRPWHRSSDAPSHLELLFKSADGFGASIVAIGCARAYLSLQTGIVAMYETSLSPGSNLDWIQPLTLVVAIVALSVVKLGGRFAAHRKALCLALGFAGTVVYALGLAAPSGSAVLIASAILSIMLFCWMLRLWCNDNCSSDLRLVLVRLCLSFIVQYLFYSVVYLVPVPVQCIIATCSPFFIMGCLSCVPRTESAPSPNLSTDTPRREKDIWILSPLNIATLGIVIVACCASHGLLFSFSETVSGVWLLGSLVIAVISLAAVMTLRKRSLFKGFVCIALLTQCLSVVLTLLFSGNNDWISLSKSMSYAVSMLLTFSIACYLGASQPAPHAGAYAARWVAIYFVAFYAAHYFERLIGPDPFASLVVVLLCLVVAAVMMLGNDWSGLAVENGRAQEESEPPETALSEQAIKAFCAHQARAAGLTRREEDVLESLLHGVPIKEIAKQGQVSVNTVRSQVQSIYRKINVHSREELLEQCEHGTHVESYHQ